MSWTDTCGNCDNHRADCSCVDGYSSTQTNKVTERIIEPKISRFGHILTRIAYTIGLTNLTRYEMSKYIYFYHLRRKK